MPMSILCKLGVPKMNPALVKYSTVRWPRDCPKFALAGGVDESEQSALLRRGPHPFAAHDDLLDAVARIYDIDPQIPVHYEVQSTEPLELDSEDTIWMEPS